MNVEQQVIAKAKSLVINQARYIYPTSYVTSMLSDAMYVAAEDMTDLQTYGYLTDKDILSDEKLLALVEKMGVEDLYDTDHCIDYIADYIVNNRADCMDLWDHLVSKI